MLKTVSTLSLSFPEYGMTNDSKFRWDSPARNSQRLQKTVFIYGNVAKVSKNDQYKQFMGM